MVARRVRWALLAVIVIGLSAVFYQVGSSLNAQKKRAVGGSSLEGMLPDAVQWIQQFHRIEIKEGKKLWEVEAAEAQYLQEREQVVVTGPRATFYLNDGEKVTVSSGRGRLQFSGKDLRRVFLRDSVEIRVRDFVIRTDRARYEQELNRITAKGPVTIAGEQVQLSGTDMVVFMKDSRFELRQDVRVTLVPENGGTRRPS